MFALIAFTLQAAVAAKFSPNAVANDPNIIVPASTAVNFWDVKKPHTHLLIYNGPPQKHHSGNPMSENLFGPLVQHSSGPDGFWPSDIRYAYNVTELQGSKAICLVDYSYYPTALADFNAFSKEFGLPVETSTVATSSSNAVFQVVYEGGTQPTTTDTGWNTEEALDIEWAHAMAPNAKIYVVESSSGLLDYCNTIASALSGVKEVSNSWGYPGEYGSGELALDADYVKSGVVFLASAGDIGGLQSYPALSPNVQGVGGTSLIMNSTNTAVVKETGWVSGGGGPSLYEPIPAFQAAIPSVANQLGGMRGSPDTAAIADPNTGVAVYYDGSWIVVGGTSVACPVTAGLVNDWGTYIGSFEPSSVGQNLLNYSLLGTSHFRDITFGTTSGYHSYSCTVGWDFVTGVGAPLELENLPTYYPYYAYSASTISGTYLSGNSVANGEVTSLATAFDNNYYQVKEQPVTNLGYVADVRALFTVTGHPQSKISGAIVTVVGSVNTGNAINEIFMYNYTTKTYDLVGSPTIPTTDGTMTVSLSQSEALNYIDSSGDVIVWTRALLPQRLAIKSVTAFTYKVDQIQVSYGYLQ